MPAIHGKISRINVNGTDLSTFTNEADYDRSRDTSDISAFGDDGHEYLGGLTDGIFDMKGHFDTAATGTPRVVLAPLLQSAAVTILWHPAGTGTGLQQDSFSAVLDKYKESSAVDDHVKWEASWKISGTPVRTDQA